MLTAVDRSFKLGRTNGDDVVQILEGLEEKVSEKLMEDRMRSRSAVSVDEIWIQVAKYQPGSLTVDWSVEEDAATRKPAGGRCHGSPDHRIHPQAAHYVAECSQSSASHEGEVLGQKPEIPPPSLGFLTCCHRTVTLWTQGSLLLFGKAVGANRSRPFLFLHPPKLTKEVRQCPYREMIVPNITRQGLWRKTISTVRLLRLGMSPKLK